MSVQSLVESIVTNARRRPAAPALVWRDETVSYGELLGLAGHARTRLGGLDLGDATPGDATPGDATPGDATVGDAAPGDATVGDAAPGDAPVGLLAPKSPAAVALILACLLDRRPFLLPSVELAERTIERLFQACGCRAVVPAEQIGEGTGQVDIPDTPSRSRPDAVTFMLTTSGSTGLPKVVPLTEEAVDRFTDWAGAAFGLGPDSVVLNFSPLNFDLCLLDVWATLKHGGRVVLVEPDRATNPGYLRSLVTDHGVTVVQAVPMFYQLLTADRAGKSSTAGGAGKSSTAGGAGKSSTAGRAEQPFDRVEHVVITGDTIAQRCLAAVPELFPKARLYNLYGCTETNDSLIHELDPYDLPRGPVPLGLPLPGVRALLVGVDGSVLTGPGEGELYVHTPFQTTGYARFAGSAGGARFAGSAGGTSSTPDDRFTGHPAGADDHIYYRTGDLVQRRPDGSLVLLGRNDFHVKVRGVRTNLQEIERVLAEHDGIAEAVVVAVPDPVGGHRLHAQLRRAPGPSGACVNSLLLREFCASRLPRTAIPSTISLTEEPLPRTSTGKPDRQLIRANIKEG